MIQIDKGIYCICIHHHSADYYLLDTMLIFVYVYIMIELHKLYLWCMWIIVQAIGCCQVLSASH